MKTYDLSFPLFEGKRVVMEGYGKSTLEILTMKAKD